MRIICLRLASLLFVFYSLFFILNSNSLAQEEFNVIYDTTYTVDKEGTAEVEQRISLTNNFSKIYASSYVLKIEGKKPENLRTVSVGKQIQTELKEVEGKYEITISFPEALVGKGKTRVFSVHYTNSQIASRNGKVWDVGIPKLATPELINEYNLTLKVPKNFGAPAYISPKPRNKSDEESLQVFSFKKDDLTKAGVVAIFGDFQVFSFTLNYHLPNASNKEIETEIALIPDTAYQKVYYDNLQPAPLSVRLDKDGNWMAKYKLKPQESKEIVARVSVQIFSQAQNHYLEVLPNSVNYYLSATDKWQVNDPQIQSLAKTLKTPRQIYDFVVNKLDYDYSRVKEDVERFGAVKALENPDRAICMEFTDLFIAISRAAGIPAREINGYAHTENPELQPLSLVADVLHAWPEYWDENKAVWQPVDPTWENTTGGIDFFDKFDLSHVTFAIHGASSVYPLPAGAYKEKGMPQKDITAKFGVMPILRNEQIEIKITPAETFFLPFSFDLPFVSNSYSIQIKNLGQSALYNRPLILKGGKLSTSTNVEFLAPYSSTTLQATARSPFFPFGIDSELTVNIGDFSAAYSLEGEHIIISRIVLLLTLVLFIITAVFSPRAYKKVKQLAGKARSLYN